jgi:hypothetical protein
MEDTEMDLGEIDFEKLDKIQAVPDRAKHVMNLLRL